MLAAEPDLVIVKPFKSGVLCRLLAEFMMPCDGQQVPSANGGVVPSLFADRARDFAARLKALRGERNRLELYALCAELSSEAMQVGAVGISAQADGIAQRIGNGAELEFLGQELGDLIRLCQSSQHAA